MGSGGAIQVLKRSATAAQVRIVDSNFINNDGGAMGKTIFVEDHLTTLSNVNIVSNNLHGGEHLHVFSSSKIEVSKNASGPLHYFL